MPSDSESEGLELVRRAVAGEPLALERLLLDHHRRLLARIQSKIPASMAVVVSAEDILQETFAEAFRGIRSFQPEGPDAFARWLTTIADHRVLDAVRSHRAAKRGGGKTGATIPDAGSSSAVMALLDLVAVDERTPSRSTAGREAVEAVQSAIAGLKPDYRDAIRLRYIEGLPVADAAARMNRTERAIHKLCARGLQRLRESLGEASRYLTRR